MAGKSTPLRIMMAGALSLMAPQSVTAQGLVDTYLSSFEGRYSAGFVEATFCSGVIEDVGNALGQAGLDDRDDALVDLSQRILSRQTDYNTLVSESYFYEINPDMEELADDELTDEMEAAGWEAVDAAMLAVYDTDEYYFILDFISIYEWLGLYAYCSEVYLPDGWLDRDVSVSAILAEPPENGFAFIRGAVEWSIEQGQVVVDWTRSTYRTIASLDICEGDLDVLGGVAIGTAATSLLAGESVLVVIGSSSILVVSQPAIATGVTVAALAGATIFVTRRGFCYLQG